MNNFESGMCCILTRHWNNFSKGDIIILGTVIKSSEHTHYEVKTIIKIHGKNKGEPDICPDAIKPYKGSMDLKVIKTKEIENYIKKQFKRQHYYKKHIGHSKYV